MTDAVGIETRSRSRSKTPGLLFGENGENGEKKGAKKIPTISLIEEEEDVVEVVPLSQGTRPKRQRRSTKAVVSDTSSEVSIESSKNLQKEVVSKVSVKTTTHKETKKSTNGNEESSEQSTSITTVMKSSAVEGADVQGNQSYFNNIFNAIKTSTPILNNKRSQRVSSEVTSSNINIAEHPAYKEYKEAGEYWNKFPKTDYTYSELSPHRRELKDGIVAMPNMSRRSIEKYQNRVEVMIQNNPTEESFLRRKFLSTTNNSFQKRSADLQYDSADEVDVSELRRQLQDRRKPSDNVINRFFLSIVSYITTAYYDTRYRLTRVFYRRNDHYSYTPIQKRKGLLQNGLESIQKFALHGFSKIYLFVSTMLCLDTWILYTRSEKTIENRRRKRFLLLLLILVPLLLLGAFLLSDDPTTNEVYKAVLSSAPNFESVTQFFRNIPAPHFPDFSLNVGWLWVPFMSLGSGVREIFFSRSAKEELKMSLDDDKLQLLMTHIDNYIDASIGQRLEENNQIISRDINEKMLVLIAGTVKDALVNYNYQLNFNDIGIIAATVRKQMESELNEKEKLLLGKIALSNEENLVRISEQMKQNVHLPLSSIKFENKNVELDEILAAVLSSDKLVSMIDSRVEPALTQLNHHEAEIKELKSELAKLKIDIMKRFTSFDGEISGFKDREKNIVDDFYKFKLENDEKLRLLLLEIDGKLAAFGDSHFSSIETSVRKNLLHIFGFDIKSSDMEWNADFIKNWVSSIFVAKSDLEERLKAVEANGNQAFKLQLDQNAGILMKEINDEINKQVEIALTAKVNDSSGAQASAGLTEAGVIKIVKNVLAIYDADKTGLVDFALETAGGQVLSTRCTENFQVKSAEISIFGIPLWYPSNTPRTVISPSVHPGECWAFQGFPGYLVVQLNNKVHVTGFTVEHISQSLAPGGVIDSAPNNFTVWGLKMETDKDPILFGSYYYSADKDAPSLQYFPVQNTKIDQLYQIVELRVESNHGNPRYTCLYRFRVHGNIIKG